MIALVVFAAVVIWLLLAVAAALFLGNVIRLRNEQDWRPNARVTYIHQDRKQVNG